ncbi:MAG TPA: extracellular solute-binding protein [Bacillota bacterium]|nr:extracellular solute-binding protein [Bacillota bacterium]
MKKISNWSFLFLLVVMLAANSLISAEPVQVNYYMWQDPTFQPIVDAFNASQKEVFVKTTVMPSADYETKILTMLAGGADIDCYMQKRQTDMFQQSKNGFIEPLDKYIKKSKYDLKSIKSYTSQISVKGKVMAIPYRGAGYFTYYNKKLFAKAGIPTPTEYVKKGEWTWEKFIEVTKKLGSGDGQQYGALIYTWPQCTVAPVIQKNYMFINAKGKLNFDEKLLGFSIKMRRDLEKAKAIMSMAELKATKTHYSKPFYEGNTGMLLIGEWFPGMMMSARDNKLLQNYTWNDWAITRLPSNNPKYATMGACTFNHIYSRSKKKEAAFKFISWMGSTQGAKVVAKNGFLPPVVDEGVKAELSKVVPDAESLNYFIEPAPRYAQWYTVYGSRVEAALAGVMEKYLASNMTEKEFMTEFKAQLNQIIKTTN